MSWSDWSGDVTLPSSDFIRYIQHLLRDRCNTTVLANRQLTLNACAMYEL